MDLEIQDGKIAGLSTLHANLPLPKEGIEQRELHVTVIDCPSTSASGSGVTTPIEEEPQRFWKNYLEECESVAFPGLPTSVEDPIVDSTVEHQFSRNLPLSKALPVAASTIFCTA